MTTTASVPGLSHLSLDELGEAWCASGGALDAEVEAELARRERAGRARTASRQRHAEWEAAAYAQYQAADAYARGNLLSAAGQKAKRDPWPMLWQGSEETARKLASEELVTFWDWQQPRVPAPGAYAASKRAGEAEAASRSNPEPAPLTPGMEAALAAARGQPAAPEAGCIARTITALGALTRQLDRTTASIAARQRVDGERW